MASSDSPLTISTTVSTINLSNTDIGFSAHTYVKLTTSPVKPQSQKTFFTNVRNSLASPLFTADLRHAEPGSYDFGFIDSTKYTGDIIYLDVNSTQGFWTVTSSGYSISGDGKQLTDNKMDGIVDTGTTLLLVPQDIVKAYYDKIDGAENDKKLGGYTFPCSAQIPDFYIGFGAYTAKITGEIINLGPVDPKKTSSKPFPPASPFPLSLTNPSKLSTNTAINSLVRRHPTQPPLGLLRRASSHLRRHFHEINVCRFQSSGGPDAVSGVRGESEGIEGGPRGHVNQQRIRLTIPPAVL